MKIRIFGMVALAALTARAEVTRNTEWRDVPDETLVGTVVDLASPGGTVTDVRTNGVSAVVGGVANINLAGGGGVSPSTVTNIASSAAVTNAGAVASAKTYADGKFLPVIKNGGTPKYTVEDSVKFVEHLNIGNYGAFILSNIANGYVDFFGQYGEYGTTVFRFSSNTGFLDKQSTLIPDNSPVVTTNMISGFLTPALAQKADRAVPATANNFASLTSSGNLADSTYSPYSFRSSSWVPSWSDVSSKPSWIGSSKPTYTYSEVGAAPAVDGGYLPISGGEMKGKLILNSLHGGIIVFTNEYYGIYSIEEGAGTFYFSRQRNNEEYSRFSYLEPDGTPVMTEGKADFHIVTTPTVTSGQIGNFDLASLTNKTVSCSVSEISGKASDILIWTWGNEEECQMTFTLPSGFTLVGDAADTKASANKKCLFSLVKISNTEVIVSKKEYN